MKNVIVLATPTLVLGPHDVGKLGNTRSVYLTNQSTTESIWLQFDTDVITPLSVTCGYQLAKGTSLPLVTQSPGGRDGCNAITAVSASGTAILTVQVIQGSRTLP
jgi:hypothetical protein